MYWFVVWHINMTGLIIISTVNKIVIDDNYFTDVTYTIYIIALSIETALWIMFECVVRIYKCNFSCYENTTRQRIIKALILSNLFLYFMDIFLKADYVYRFYDYFIYYTSILTFLIILGCISIRTLYHTIMSHYYQIQYNMTPEQRRNIEASFPPRYQSAEYDVPPPESGAPPVYTLTPLSKIETSPTVVSSAI
jgi:hypothetical protein